MYGSDLTVLAGILGIILVITFFVMAYRLKRIMVAIEVLGELEFKKPENRKTITCVKCKKEFTISIAKKQGTINCPHCQAINRIDSTSSNNQVSNVITEDIPTYDYLDDQGRIRNVTAKTAENAGWTLVQK